MLDEGLGGNVIRAANGRKVRVGAGTFGDKFLVPRIGKGRILRYGGLNAFDSEPVSYQSVSISHRVGSSSHTSE